MISIWDFFVFDSVFAEIFFLTLCSPRGGVTQEARCEQTAAFFVDHLRPILWRGKRVLDGGPIKHWPIFESDF